MLTKIPGFLGYGEIIAISANWPMYPPGIGWKIAIKSLGNFPIGTVFYEVSDIDRCKLLINEEPQKTRDPFDANQYHVAIWHEDLVELKKRGFVEGVLEKTDYEFEMVRFENLKKEFGRDLKLDNNGNIIFFIKDNNGNLRETTYHKPEPNEDEDVFSFRVHIPHHTTPLFRGKVHQ